MSAPQMSYSYAVTRADAGLEEELGRLRGVAGAPVRLVRARGLAVAVSPVPERDFGESALKARLEDLDWLESVARAHHSVVEAIFARTTVLPLRLATLHLDDDRVRDMLDRRSEEFAGLLDRLADGVEWGVKVYAVPPPAPRPAPRSPAPAATATTGRDYLRGRRQQRTSSEDAWRAARDAVLRVDAAARGLAVDRVQHRLQEGELATGPGHNVANDAYLVPRERAHAFQERVRDAVEGLDGIRVEITGPWAPYSFTASDDPGDAADTEGATGTGAVSDDDGMAEREAGTQ
ncbi:GvpL/GvpF family gas vesicle protein [Streptomyces sp. NPDC002018]|uniref:GvpL/GvpF family gas vesicle protein n=1 Tax=Streptomyces sp. NPDC002018 TaxID=3364629 RepID=UPI0036A0EA0C